MEKYYHFYEKSYEKFLPDWFQESNLKAIDNYLKENSESLISFIESYELQFNLPSNCFRNKKVLVLGCGLGALSFYLESRGAFVTGLDVSKLAISQARDIGKLKRSSCEFLVRDCTKNLDLGEFDYIFDDHLLHCLALDSDREAYMSSARAALTTEGLFFLEMMAFHGEIKIPVDYRFDEDSVLWKDLGQSEIMIRKIASSIEVEKDIKKTGFFINYLYYHSELSFQVFTDYPSFPHEFLPKTISLTCKRAMTL